MSRTFRHSMGARLAAPFVLCVFLVVALIALTGHRGPGFLLGWGIVAAGVGATWILRMGGVLWGAFVTVDDRGVSWKEGSGAGRLAWEEIGALGSSANRSRLDVGLLEKNSARLHVLPLMTRELYEILKSRVGGLPPQEEGELYNRWSA